MLYANSAALINKCFPDSDPSKYLADLKARDDKTWEKLKLSDFSVDNQKDYDLSSCTVWVPRGEKDSVKKSYHFRVMSDPVGSIFALATPAGGKISLILRGQGQRVVLLSESPMTFSARLVGHARLLIGEETAIMGARIFLNNSDVLIGAKGLWSDEVIVQGSDQHGIIDLEQFPIRMHHTQPPGSNSGIRQV